MQSGSNSSISINATSTISGNSCNFWGGAKAGASGCAVGALSTNPIQGCITGAAQSVATHTAGCVKINPIPPNTYPCPQPNTPPQTGSLTLGE